MSDDIQDFFVATQQGITQLYIKNRNGVIPLKYAGDGVVRFLYLAAAILANKGSLFLIDEIENGFHYSLYRNAWNVLARIADDNRSQIIATSHSYENIAAAVKGIKDAGLEDSFSLHRLEQSDGEVSDHYYDYEMAAAAVKNDMEVR